MKATGSAQVLHNWRRIAAVLDHRLLAKCRFCEQGAQELDTSRRRGVRHIGPWGLLDVTFLVRLH